ncbi:PilN domain-containing protein [Desulfovibrio sp. JC022]|uniref:PilN domain-containing protein n=1 Tax=Desulfovibrio sp. JC022 TaxID=2593642 RepID=UPI0013D53ABF|nr:PilN domain-containing protein [Desulfovibrio sp. JC022]NDV22275.1 PilN domain-containing protein [Desulfovibrio sp. JC022]
MNFKKLLKIMPLTPSFGNKSRIGLVFDVHGHCAASFEYSSKGKQWLPLPQLPETNHPRPCFMVLPSAMLALCRTPIPDKEQKDAVAALDMESGQRLFRSPETGGREIRCYGGENGLTATLGWLSNEYLHECLETAKGMGFQVTTIVLPEFDLKVSGPTLLVSREKEETRLCCIHKKVPVIWQVVPDGGPSLASALGVVLAELEAEGKPKPEKVVVWIPPGGGEPDGFTEVITNGLPGIPVEKVRSYEDLLSLLRMNHVKGSFHESLEEWERIPLAPKDYLRPGLAFAGAIAGCLLLFFSVIHLNTQDADVLKQEAHKVLFLAKRTDVVTMEVREYVRRNREILRYTVQKPFVSHVFRDLGDSVPAQVKLNTMRLDQSGKITLQGEAKNEISLMALLENLSSAQIFSNAVLASMSKLEQGQGFRFVVELDFPAWQSFFKPKNKQGETQ